MTIFFICSNIILISILLVIVLKDRKRTSVLSNLEDVELIEFQQNLKELIDQLHKVSENEIKDMEAKKKELDEAIATAETKIKELRYLIDRNQIIRKAEYKNAIASGPVSNDDLLFMEVKKAAVISEQPVKQKPMPAKFLINEVPSGNAPADNQDAAAENKPKNKYEHINNLIKNGLGVEEIAKVTGLSRGEIELIRNIKK